MADPGFQDYHSATTTGQSSSTTVKIAFDSAYIRTMPGVLKIVQLVLNLTGFLCIKLSGILTYADQTPWFNFVAVTGLSVTGILLVLYLFHIVDRFFKIPSLKFEFVYCVTLSLCYLIVASLVVSLGDSLQDYGEKRIYSKIYKAGGICGFCAMVAYAADAVCKYFAIKTEQRAQRDRV